jgi:glucose/arabinose dehydrogenase
MMERHLALRSIGFALAASLGTTACGDRAKLPLEAGFGPTPTLPAPHQTLIPTIKVAPARGWPAGGKPVAAPGLVVNLFADRLDHPRWLHVLPNGDVLVAESSAPPRPEDSKGIKAFFMRLFMKKAGAAVPSADRITILRDADKDGVAEVRRIFLGGLHSPFGMALVGDDLYVANTDAILRFPYRSGTLNIEAAGAHLADLPAGPRNHHWTKTIIANADGRKIYATVGSNSNVAEHGMDEEEGRAAIWEIDRATGRGRIFASGLRNPNGMAWEPATNRLWTVVNERDEIGSDLVPDYLTSVQEGGFYGWPYSYFGQHVDKRVKPPRPDYVARALMPDYALGPHTASLGLAFLSGGRLAELYGQGMFIGQHGSWNRDPPSGYKIIFVPFANGRPSGPARDILTGFLDAKGNAYGRPVGVAINGDGGLLIADDVGNRIWRVTVDRQ